MFPLSSGVIVLVPATRPSAFADVADVVHPRPDPVCPGPL
jgi:hypothetical protein